MCCLIDFRGKEDELKQFDVVVEDGVVEICLWFEFLHVFGGYGECFSSSHTVVLEGELGFGKL